MFTLDQIQHEHSKVKSGADFPAYMQQIKKFGVTHYEVFVSDGSTVYHGKDGYKVWKPAAYRPIQVAHQRNLEVFKRELLAHQQGLTDYSEFIQMCGETGIARWEVQVDRMTCTYFDGAGEETLTERIPGADRSSS